MVLAHHRSEGEEFVNFILKAKRSVRFSSESSLVLEIGK